MKRSKRKPPGRLQRLQALLSTRAGHLLVRTTVVALVFLLAGMVMRQARAYTYRLEGFRVVTEAVEFVGLPAWCDAQIRASLAPRFFRPLSVSIYDPDAEAALRSHAEAHPLIESVRQVRLLYPNRARVEVRLRVPVARVAAWVRGPDGYQVVRWRLLSDDGCLLPRAPYRTYLAGLPYDLPVVTGIQEPKPGAPGEVWEDRTGRVEEAVYAARLAGRLERDLRGRVRLTHVDVSRFPAAGHRRKDGEVRLRISCPSRTRGGPRIERTVEWGRTERARADVPWEDGYDKKVTRLRKILTSPNPPPHVEVRWDVAEEDRTAP